MNISKISAYLFSQNASAKNQKVEEKSNESEQVKNSSGENQAVNVSSEFRLNSAVERANKIAELKKQVDAGTYRIPTEKLAEKIDQELFG